MEIAPAQVPWDLASPEVIADPYPAYQALRDISPVRYVRVPAGVAPGIDQPIHSYALLRHADVLAACRDPETYSSNVTDTLKVLPRFTLNHDDPPRHTRLRRLVGRAFTPRRVTELEPWIQSTVSSLLDALGDGPVDLIQGYAIPLPMRVIATLLGIPPEQYATFRTWSEATITYKGISPEERRARLGEMNRYLAEALTDRRQSPTGDMISDLVHAEINGETLTDPEALGFCITLLIGGNETTTNLIGNMMHLLAQRPDLWQRAREDRALVEPIIEETLRYHSPVQRASRVARRPIEIAGVTIPEGHLLDVFFGAANRDPAVHEDPDSFRIDRPAIDHVTFGLGNHFCMGATLARTEARITLDAFLDRFATLDPGDEPPQRQNRSLMPFGFTSLPLVPRRG